MVELAEVACNEVASGTVPIDTRASTVASAMAEAVAEVVAVCTGQGNTQVSVSGRATAEATAEAVGTASANIVATSEVCGLCTSGLNAFTTAVETVAVTAVAEASIMVRPSLPAPPPLELQSERKSALTELAVVGHVERVVSDPVNAEV